MLCLASTTALGELGVAGQGVAEPAMSQIELDGSLPGSVEVGEGLYTIHPDLENLVGADEAFSGGNLFYSLRHFILAPGDSALFPATVPGSAAPITLSPDNAIIRVTGGLPSEIFGPVEFDFEHANTFFLNPYGVIVGDGGSFNVPASFFLSTADRLSFVGGDFETFLSGTDPMLEIEGLDCCSGDPVAFGFDSGPNAEVVFEGTVLQAWEDGTIVQVVAGDVRLIDGAKLRIPGGEIHLAAVGANSASVPTALVGDAGVPVGGPSNGRVELSAAQNNTAFLSTLGGESSEGRVVLRGGQLVLERAFVQAGGDDGTETAIDLGASESITITRSVLQATETEQVSDPDHVGMRLASPVISVSEFSNIQSASRDRSAGGIEVVATESLTVGGGFSLIQSTTIGEATGGSVNITAGRLELGDGANIFTRAGTNPSGTVFATGPAGDINIVAGDILLNGGSEAGSAIYSDTETGSPGGSLALVADRSLSLANGSQIYTETKAKSTYEQPGAAGNIEIVATNVSLQTESSIRSTSFTGAQSGQIDLFVDGSLTLSDLSGVASQLLASGDSGDVTVHAGSITLERGGTINTETPKIDGEIPSEATGAPGDITLMVDGAIRLEGVGFSSTGGPVQALISTRVVNPDSSADAGNIEIRAGSLELIDGGLISSRTTTLDSPSDAGAVVAEAALEARPGGADAGNIDINVDTLIRLSGSSEGYFSEIAARGSAGSAGSITLTAENVDIRGGTGAFATSFAAGDAGTIDVTATESLVMVDGYLLTERGNSAGGGEITINAGDTILLENSRVEATVRQGTASGGDINIGQVIEPRFVVLSSSEVVAEAEKGSGGDITISAGSLIQSADSEISAASDDPTLDGQISIDALEQELTGRLVPLELAYLDVGSLLLPPCAARLEADRSSLTVRGRPALGSDPGGLLPSPILGPETQGGPSLAFVGSYAGADHILASGTAGAGGCSDTAFWDQRP